MNLRLPALLCALVFVTPAFAAPPVMPIVSKSGNLTNADGVVLYYSAPVAWPDGTVAVDLGANGQSSAEVQVDAISGGDSITFTRSLVTGGTYYSFTNIYDQNGVNVSTISTPGIYSVRGGGLLKYAKTGSASTPVVTLRAAQ